MNLECTLKYVRLANSNDTIFKTDLASLKCNASSFNQLTCPVVLEVLPLHHNTENKNASLLEGGDPGGQGYATRGLLAIAIEYEIRQFFFRFFSPNEYFFNLHLQTLLFPFLPD